MQAVTVKVVEMATGRVVNQGDAVTNRDGQAGVYTYAVRANEAGRDGKVIVDGREYYARVWGLTVEEITEAQS